MDTPPSPADRHPPARPASSPPDWRSGMQNPSPESLRELADQVLVEQSQRWLAGRGEAVESYFKRWPELRDDPETRLDLIYGEWRARSRSGEEPDWAGFQRRFPEDAVRLAQQVLVRDWIGSVDAAPTAVPMSDNRRATDAVDHQSPLAWEDYRLHAKLGSGSWGDVYRAHQKSLGREVAIKVLRPAVAEDRRLVERFLREAQTLAQMRHPHIVDVYGVGRTPEGSYFLAMTLVEGEDLGRQPLPMPWSDAARIVAEVAEAVHYAHSRNIIHRDLKPSNILLDRDRRAMVTDFGLAKRLSGSGAHLSAEGDIIGTPQYMAPEQADGRWGEVGPASDVFGLGGVLYTLLTGRPPIEGGSAWEILSRLTSPEPLALVRDGGPAVPDALRAVCTKALHKSAVERYSSAEEFRLALRSAASAGVQFTLRSPMRRRILAAAALAAASTVVAATLVGNARKDEPAGVAPHRASAIVPPAIQESQANLTDWSMEIFRPGARERPISLLRRPGPIQIGDRIRLRIELSRPAHAYVFWIAADGSVQRIYPTEDGEDSAVDAISCPSSGDRGFPVQGSPGTEVCVLVLRSTALRRSESMLAALRPGQPFPSLQSHPILLNGVPLAAAAMGRPELPTEPSPLDSLSAATRRLGPPEPIGDAVGEAIRVWRSQLPADLGDVHTLAFKLALPNK